MIIADTCVMGRLPVGHDPQRRTALNALFTLRRTNEVVVAPQVLYFSGFAINVIDPAAV
jgi:hypothetical protein